MPRDFDEAYLDAIRDTQSHARWFSKHTPLRLKPMLNVENPAEYLAYKEYTEAWDGVKKYIEEVKEGLENAGDVKYDPNPPGICSMEEKKRDEFRETIEELKVSVSNFKSMVSNAISALYSAKNLIGSSSPNNKKQLEKEISSVENKLAGIKGEWDSLCQDGRLLYNHCEIIKVDRKKRHKSDSPSNGGSSSSKKKHHSHHHSGKDGGSSSSKHGGSSGKKAK